MKFIIFFLLIGCTKIGPSNTNTCANNGNVDFIYIDVPCEECVIEIETILDSNSNIFDYDMVRNKENHIIIWICYHSKNTDILSIEKSITDIGLSVNQDILNTQTTLCCGSQ